MFRHGFAPLVRRKSLSNTNPYFAVKAWLCAFKPFNVLSVKQTHRSWSLSYSDCFKSCPIAGENTRGVTDSEPYHPVIDARSNGIVPGTNPRMERKIFCASASLFPSFCRTKWVNSGEQSELSFARLCCCSHVAVTISNTPDGKQCTYVRTDSPAVHIGIRIASVYFPHREGR